MAHSVEGITLGEAATTFLATVPVPEKEISQQEVLRFVRWYGREKLVAQLTPSQIAKYAERLAQSDADLERKVEPVRAFLLYTKQQKLVATNLAAHLKVKKGAAKVPVAKGGPVAQPTLTAEGIAAVKAEREKLLAERLMVTQEVRRAREDKDFRENAPLEAAREQLAQIESKIKEVDALLGGAVMTARETVSAKIGPGSEVTLVGATAAETLKCILVDPGEANPTRGRISFASPLGKVLLGKGVGDEVEVVTPSGGRRYRIASIG